MPSQTVRQIAKKHRTKARKDALRGTGGLNSRKNREGQSRREITDAFVRGYLGEKFSACLFDSSRTLHKHVSTVYPVKRPFWQKVVRPELRRFAKEHNIRCSEYWSRILRAKGEGYIYSVTVALFQREPFCEDLPMCTYAEVSSLDLSQFLQDLRTGEYHERQEYLRSIYGARKREETHGV